MTEEEIITEGEGDKNDEKDILSSMRDQMIVKMVCVGVCVLAMMVDILMIIIRMVNGNGNGNDTSIDDINKMISTLLHFFFPFYQQVPWTFKKINISK